MSMTSANDQWLHDNAPSLLNAVSDAVISINSHGYVNYTNLSASLMFGFSADEMVNQPIRKLIPERYGSKHQSYIERYILDGGTRVRGSGRSLLAQDKEGVEFPVSIELSEIVTSKESWFVGVVQDLRKQTPIQRSLVEQRERFAQINRLSTLGEMAVNIAHEINQPLAAIAMYARASQQLLVREDVDKVKLLDALEKLNAQSLRAGEVIERIQYLVRSDSGAKIQVPINKVLQDIYPLLVSDTKASGIDLELMLPKVEPEIVCDPLQIQQVLINLVRNAIDAMLEVGCKYGRTISIGCDVDSAGLVSVSVVDAGSGIDEELMSSIFDAFETSKVMGTGLGLPVSRSMIEYHEGTLSCSNNEEVGATFTFRLSSVTT